MISNTFTSSIEILDWYHLKEHLYNVGGSLRRLTKFIFQLLYSDDFVTDVLARCTGPSYTAIDSTSLSELQVNIPDIPEQTKIANFLTAIDEKITEDQTYLDTVKQYKQGLVQQMFV